ncbi:hypothetical protein Defa_00650 [Desulfovibrio sp. TH_2024_36128]|uniref:Uncharacterized protein n=1 Tax=Desulfovibrio falkowii TaxID=3136602 RepID=A0ABQ0E4E2_9BACT
MVHIGIAGDKEHIQTVPAEGVHFFHAHRDKKRLPMQAVRAGDGSGPGIPCGRPGRGKCRTGAFSCHWAA